MVITVHNVMGTLVQKTKKHITEICQQTVKTEMVYKSLLNAQKSPNMVLARSFKE